MLTYHWAIDCLSIKDIGENKSVVYKIVFTKKGVTEDNLEGCFKSAVYLSIDESTDFSSFVEYMDLTEDIVVSWIKDRTDESMIDKEIQNEIDLLLQNNQEVEYKYLPWRLKHIT